MSHENRRSDWCVSLDGNVGPVPLKVATALTSRERSISRREQTRVILTRDCAREGERETQRPLIVRYVNEETEIDALSSSNFVAGAYS